MATQTKILPSTVSNPWWGHDPSDKQLTALWAYEQCPDLFYGGAAGPGKTSYLLMAAVQYVHYPHYEGHAGHFRPLGARRQNAPSPLILGTIYLSSQCRLACKDIVSE